MVFIAALLITWHTPWIGTHTAWAELPQQAGSVDLLSEANLRIDGAIPGDMAGQSVAPVGDVNGDGLADVIVGAGRVDGGAGNDSGAAYVVFGSTSTDPVDLYDLGSRGFRIEGAAAGDRAGSAVGGAGDLNDDGRADVIVGAERADTPGRPDAGAAYVVFGKSTTGTVDLGRLDEGGIVITGAAAGDHAGFSVAAAGDMNGGRRGDVVVGAYSATRSGRTWSGAAYVVFGETAGQSVDLGALAGRGFEIRGAAAYDYTGYSVGGGGDVDGDGHSDVIVGAPYSTAGGYESGAAYIVFGDGSDQAVDLAALGERGITAIGADPGDQAGWSVAGAGDLDSDGRGDVVIGAHRADGTFTVDSGAAFVVRGDAGPATIDLGYLGSRGFEIEGGASQDHAGYSVAGAGDVNGDGLQDLIVGAPGTDHRGRQLSGSVYVVYGSESLAPVMLGALGERGFIMDGADNDDYAGRAVAGAGDINGDRRPDVIVGAEYADSQGAHSGSAYIAYGFGETHIEYAEQSLAAELGKPIAPMVPTLERTGQPQLTASPPLPAGLTIDPTTGVISGTPTEEQPPATYTVTLTDLAGYASDEITVGVAPPHAVDLLDGEGIRLDGAEEEDLAGATVAPLGDVNGDGWIDLVVGAPAADNNGRTDSGSAYVLFGGTSLQSMDLAELGGGGFRIDGANGGDKAGSEVAAAGDVNGDGRVDLVVGAPLADNRGTNSGSAYVVFGKGSTTPVDLRSLGSQGFRMDGPAAFDQAGSSVSGAGDVNSDGRAEVVVGAPLTDIQGTSSGSAYLVFGSISTTPVNLGSLGSRGFRIEGAEASAKAGWSVAGGGDINGDGLPDVVVGAPSDSVLAPAETGAAYVVFGKPSTSSVDLAALGDLGIAVVGAQPQASTGWSVAGAGDVDGDGLADIVVGAPGYDASDRIDSGAAYVMLGRASTAPVDLSLPDGTIFRIDGARELDAAGSSVSGADDLNGDGQRDVVIGAPRAGNNGRSDSGSVYALSPAGLSEAVDLADAEAWWLRVDGAGEGDRAGSSAAGAGDLNGDGISDIAIGAPYADNSDRIDSGSIYILSAGAPGPHEGCKDQLGELDTASPTRKASIGMLQSCLVWRSGLHGQLAIDR